MKMTPQDWKKLRAPIMILGIVIVLLAVFVGYAEKRKIDSVKAQQKQSGQLAQAKRKYQTSGEEKDMIVKYLPAYQKMIADGFVGEERRIEWVDNLRSIHINNKLFNINYSIGLQESFKPNYAPNLGSFILRRSIMHVDLSMLHEGDLLTLLRALDQQQTTPFIVRDCEIDSVKSDGKTPLSPNVKAKCELDWLTVKEPLATGATP